MSALIAGGSTQSRARRPLPPGAVSARTLESWGARELVEFEMSDGTTYTRSLLSWVVGQWGGLWARPDPEHIPTEIVDAIWDMDETPGSYGHAAEHELADTLAEIYAPYIAGGDVGVRLALNGSDACNMAARLARAWTRSDMIVGYGYHGHADAYAHHPQFAGVLSANIANHEYYPEIGPLPRHGYPAALVIEVPAWNGDLAIRAMLAEYRAFCDRTGALLVMDEVVTGSRISLAGACEKYNIKADLVCLGKCISATGMTSALVGRSDVMQLLADKVFYSGTFFGAAGAARVCVATLRWLMAHRDEVYGPNGHLEKIGNALKDGYNALGIKTVGQPARSIFVFENDARWLRFCSLMIAEGVMVHRPNFVTLCHQMSDVEFTLETARKVIGEAC